MNGTVYLPAECGEQLKRRAREDYPREACGLLVGSRKDREVRVQRITEARNLHPEGRNDRYLLDPEHFLQTDRVAEEEGSEILGVWHSHPGQPAVPSATDRESAWSGWSYLIVSIGPEVGENVRAWRLCQGCFLEETLRG